jgi:hypothetical protein
LLKATAMSARLALAACLSFVALGASPAGADLLPPSAVAPAPAPTRYAAALGRPLPPRKDPGVALGLSLGITAGGMATMLIGDNLDSDLGGGLATAGALAWFIGPSTGHAYAGRIGNTGLAIRGVSALGGVVAIGGLIGCIAGSGDDLDDHGHLDDDDDCGLFAGLLVASSLGYLGGAIYEIVDAPRAARRHNARYGLDVQVAPTVVGSHGARAPGVALAGRF